MLINQYGYIRGTPRDGMPAKSNSKGTANVGRNVGEPQTHHDHAKGCRGKLDRRQELGAFPPDVLIVKS